jgi:hypothetical protein
MVGPMIRDQRQAGATLRQIVNRLRVDGIKTARGGQRTPTAVRNVLERLRGYTRAGTVFVNNCDGATLRGRNRYPSQRS